MHIIGIDPGFDKIGASIFDTKTKHIIASHIIRTKKTESIELRLKSLYTQLETLLTNFHPKVLVMEQLFFFKNQKTMIQVAQAQGAIMLLASLNGLPVVFLTPLQIKQIITGYGNADKKSVQKMLELSLHISLKGKEDDETDAIACGYAYCLVNPRYIT